MQELMYNPESGIPYLGLLTDLLKGIAWPLAAYFMAIAFKVELKQLLSRVIKAGPTGVVFKGDLKLKVFLQIHQKILQN